MAYDIALPRYPNGLSCNIPDDKFPRSEQDIVRWLFASEQGVPTLRQHSLMLAMTLVGTKGLVLALAIIALETHICHGYIAIVYAYA